MAKYFFKHLDIIEKYFKKPDLGETLYDMWTESHRTWHNISHLDYLLKQIEHQQYALTKQRYESLILAAYFHDVIYFPDKKDNESKSIKFFLTQPDKLTQILRQKVITIINGTKLNFPPKDKLSDLFWVMDNNIFFHGNLIDMINYEKKIFKEYQFVSYDLYKNERIKFLESRINDSIFPRNKILFLINYIDNYKPKIGIYAGSFNPFHKGHLNILQKAEKIFDKVIIAYGNNPDKPDREIESVKELRFRETVSYNTLITTYLDKVKAFGCDVSLIRGLRNGNDLNYESVQTSFIQDIRPNTKIVYFTCDKKFEHISSSAIRSLAKFDEEQSNKYIVK